MNRILFSGWLKLSFQPRFLMSQNEKMLAFTDVLTKQSLKDSKQQVSKGRSWKPDELRLKSTEDLHKLWYVMLKEKNLLLSDGIFNKKVIGVKGRMGKLNQLKRSMARLKGVVGEREVIQKKYRRELENQYVKEKQEEYLANQKELERQQIFVPEITPNLLKAKLRDLKQGKDNINYIEETVKIQTNKKQFREYLQQKYNYKSKKIVNADQILKPDQSEEQVIRQFKTTVHQQIAEAVKIPQEEVLRAHVKNWSMLNQKQKRIIVNFINARKARESKQVFLRELDLLGQKIAYDLKQHQSTQTQQG